MRVSVLNDALRCDAQILALGWVGSGEGVGGKGGEAGLRRGGTGGARGAAAFSPAAPPPEGARLAGPEGTGGDVVVEGFGPTWV